MTEQEWTKLKEFRLRSGASLRDCIRLLGAGGWDVDKALALWRDETRAWMREHGLIMDRSET